MARAHHGDFNVGGVLLARPFRVRRLGHFGFNLTDMANGVPFYRDLLGFAVSDEMDLADRVKDRSTLAGAGDSRAYFMRYGTDHHAFVIFPKRILEITRPETVAEPRQTINQITWQVGSLAEVVDATAWMLDRGVPFRRAGRDTPGSNWETYVYDPDGHVVELYYGIEQVGWDGASKPGAMYRGFREVPPLPQIAEYDEVLDARKNGIDLGSGHQQDERLPRTHDVDGVLLARPFKITRLGPVRLFVEDVGAATEFWTATLGFTVTTRTTYEGHSCVFLRCGTEHHSVALYPTALQKRLGLSEHTTCMSFGVQVATYRQLRDATRFLSENGVQIIDLPPELSPGMEHSAFALDPDGHAIQLYFAMEQVADGPATVPSSSWRDWPETISASGAAFTGETLLGPWG